MHVCTFFVSRAEQSNIMNKDMVFRDIPEWRNSTVGEAEGWGDENMWGRDETEDQTDGTRFKRRRTQINSREKSLAQRTEKVESWE